ncbi:MAG: hypothetical protein MI923_12455 [Phycisphaerales bacterium]|nr:hypothetical protein [Phycisphaerales bacterium]
MCSLPQDHPLRRWFAALIETSFQEEIGISEPSVLEYLTELLTGFIHMERINLLCDGSGRKIEDVAEMLSEAELGGTAVPEQRRLRYHLHIGDFTLFWTGVYPENLRQLHRRRSPDDLLDYFDQGKRSYAIASNLSTDDSRPPASVLQQLSDQFEYCVYGLGLVRRQWEQSGPGDLGSFNIMSN